MLSGGILGLDGVTILSGGVLDLPGGTGVYDVTMSYGVLNGPGELDATNFIQGVVSGVVIGGALSPTSTNQTYLGLDSLASSVTVKQGPALRHQPRLRRPDHGEQRRRAGDRFRRPRAA